MAIEASSADVAGALEGEQVTPLPRSFLVEASGPATIIREHGDVTERTEGEVEISYRIETLEEFGEFWALRNKRHPKQEAINRLLGRQEDDQVRYDEQAAEWDVQIDVHVQAYFGLAETIVEFDGDLDVFDTPDRRFFQRIANNIGKNVDEFVADFAHDLKPSSLWGPGTRIAELAVKHGNREDLDGAVEALCEALEEDD
ncbi:hypothetical protein [Halosolutus halophilus]|uniref:hypothetical protein n=1 Tax=Halosolutus halophilus TaxID=1552990 RepID=UPI0022351194|nr:hypothetical protein [Halosolutus halophilus]